MTKSIEADVALRDAEPQIVSDFIRRNELQVWCVAEHVVRLPLTYAR